MPKLTPPQERLFASFCEAARAEPLGQRSPFVRLGHSNGQFVRHPQLGNMDIETEGDLVALERAGFILKVPGEGGNYEFDISQEGFDHVDGVEAVQAAATAPASDEAPSEPTFDVALSFAGANRPVVREVSALLQDRGVTSFFDELHRVDLWGKDLYDTLARIYSNRARYVVMFISKHYVESSLWTDHERKAAQGTALRIAEPFILPVRLDDSEVPGLSPNVSYMDLRLISHEELADAIAEKVGVDRAEAPNEKLPDGWEFELFGRAMREGLEAIRSRLNDYHFGIVRPTGQRLTERDDIIEDMQARFDAMHLIYPNIERILEPEKTEWAFGAPGVPGDADRIRHMAASIIETYALMLDWSDALRGLAVPDEYRSVYHALSMFVEEPLRELESYVTDYETRLPDLLATMRDPDFNPHEPLVVTFTLVATLPHATVDAYTAALHAAFD